MARVRLSNGTSLDLASDEIWVLRNVAKGGAALDEIRSDEYVGAIVSCVEGGLVIDFTEESDDPAVTPLGRIVLDKLRLG